MMNKKYGLGLHYRLMFYLCGFLFACASYILGVWAFGIELASSGDSAFYRDLLKNLTNSFQNHMATFFLWQIVCICIAGIIGYLFDEQVAYRRSAEIRANTDGVTDVFNHRYFQETLVAEVERASRYKRNVCIIMFDLDNFKKYNDTWGHQEGDNLLKWFASLCSANIRNVDLIARYGGEEFVIILPESDAKDALEVSERIRIATSKKSAVEFGKNKTITVSAGIASYPEHGESKHELIVNADTALYIAKLRGKNRSHCFESDHNIIPNTSTTVKRTVVHDDDLDAIEALAAVADATAVHTKGHSISVMNLAVALGARIGLSAEELSNLRCAALLHDLGRIATPEEILEKKTPLKRDEWKKIEKHANLGARIVERIQEMTAIAPGIKHHHERYDGKGYPSGLSGKNIPLLARIITIADAFDAMTSSRSYRQALNTADAFDELRRGSGSQFDPDLVEFFIKYITEDRKKNRAA
ncbi:MAG: diguanylate cyclase [Armatimonadetes bacterium]|nr:diguanylate cyclase [Armatimonadota bacterium]